ncbi:guaA, partial [Symbiodinium sp. CCMP2592]
ETILRAAHIPIPDSFAGTRKSYTLSPEDYCVKLDINGQELGSMYVLWAEKGMYVNLVLDRSEFPDHNVNKKGGATVGINKVGGWANAFKIACSLAGWSQAGLKPAPKSIENDVD